jgi:hypothetical protein
VNSWLAMRAIQLRRTVREVRSCASPLTMSTMCTVQPHARSIVSMPSGRSSGPEKKSAAEMLDACIVVVRVGGTGCECRVVAVGVRMVSGPGGGARAI